jgi:hypothetical protein
MTPTLTPAEQAKLIKGFANHEQFALESLRIQTKSGGMVPMVLQPAQLKLDKAIRKQRAAGVPVRICYLKAGQVMVSSGTAAQNFHHVPFMPGRHCLAVADSEAHSKLVFRYYKDFQEGYVPFSAGIPGAGICLPHLVNDKDDTLHWANGSFIKCVTGANVHAGRSQPWQAMQISEFGFMPTGQIFLDGALPRVPNLPETLVIIESTGFGEGGAFFDLCKKVQDPQTAAGWQFVFFGGYEHPEYSTPIDDLHYFEKSLSKEEKQERAQYPGLTLEYLNWRRAAIENICGGKVSVFRQEFPNNPREAFQGSSRTYLDLGAVERCTKVEEPMVGELEIVQFGPERTVQFSQKEHGALSIYRQPKKGGRYVIGADSAQGKDPEAKKGGKSDPDYAAASVKDADTGEQVAVFHDRVTEAYFGRIVYALGWYYRWAFIVPETVGAGRAFLQALLEQGYPQDRIYRKQRPAGDMRPVTFNELGYQTDSVSRPVLLSSLDTAFLEGSITIHHGQTAQECRTLIRDPEGVVAAKFGNHDDLVFAEALATIGLRFCPVKPAQSAEERRQAWRPVKYGQRGRDDDDD